MRNRFIDKFRNTALISLKQLSVLDQCSNDRVHGKKEDGMRKITDLQALFRFGTAIVGLVALGTCLVSAQGSTGTISGVVLDISGAVIPGVMVTAKHTDSGLTRTAVSHETSAYRVQFLRVGAYDITQALPAFE